MGFVLSLTAQSPGLKPWRHLAIAGNSYVARPIGDVRTLAKGNNYGVMLGQMASLD